MKTTIAISPTETTSDLNDILWGIKWFDMKWSLLYRFYMFSISRHVRKHDAGFYFQGSLMEVLESEMELDRDSLLIVRYPNADSFLRLASSSIFSLKSRLATLAIRKFSFGFARRIYNHSSFAAGSTDCRQCYYLVHIFQTDTRRLQMLQQDIQHFANNNVRLYFAGIKTAQIRRSKDDGTVTKPPFFMDGILLWESDDLGSLWKFSQEQWYLAFKIQHKSNGLYLFNKEK